jgi:transposase
MANHLARGIGQSGVQLQPLGDALRQAFLARQIVHADEMAVQMLAPEGKAHRVYVWAVSKKAPHRPSAIMNT